MSSPVLLVVGIPLATIRILALTLIPNIDSDQSISATRLIAFLSFTEQIKLGFVSLRLKVIVPSSSDPRVRTLTAMRMIEKKNSSS